MSSDSQAARRSAVLRASFAVIAWGLSFIATKEALREATPATLVWLRFGSGLVVLGLIAAYRGELGGVTRRDLVSFAAFGLLGITANQWLQANALQSSSATAGGWIAATSPVFIALLSTALLRERFHATTAAGLAVAAIGVLLVTGGGATAPGPGDAMLVASAVNWALFCVILRRVLARHPAARVSFYSVAFGWLVSTLWLAADGGWREIGGFSTTAWVAIAFLGVVCTGIAYVCWCDALGSMPASTVGAFMYVEPLVTVAAAAALLGERITPATIGGGALILVGVRLASLCERSERRAAGSGLANVREPAPQPAADQG